MKIVVFENEMNLYDLDFESLEINFFGEDTFEFHSKSDSFNFEKIKKYDLAVVDLSLSPQSTLDGFDIIKMLLDEYNYEKIVIFTGRGDALDMLKEHGFESLDVISKPMVIDEAAEIIKRNISK